MKEETSVHSKNWATQKSQTDRTFKMKNMRNNKILISVFIAIIFAIYFTACSNSQQKAGEEETTVTIKPEDIVKHGEYLVTIMGCNDCHSPKKLGVNGPEIIPELLLSGYPSDRPIVKFDNKKIKEGFTMSNPDLTATAGPWGVSFAGNLTPDETGIGNWTEEQFKKAITQGKFKGLDGGRMLLPPMPWSGFTSLKDEDVNAIFMYLKSIKPIRNIVPPPVSPDKM